MIKSAAVSLERPVAFYGGDHFAGIASLNESMEHHHEHDKLKINV